jgi:hypothetical protein
MSIYKEYQLPQSFRGQITEMASQERESRRISVSDARFQLVMKPTHDQRIRLNSTKNMISFAFTDSRHCPCHEPMLNAFVLFFMLSSVIFPSKFEGETMAGHHPTSWQQLMLTSCSTSWQASQTTISQLHWADWQATQLPQSPQPRTTI